MKRILLSVAILTLSLAIPSLARAVCTGCAEVSSHTFTGDFAEGGDLDTSDRLLGNTSGYALLFIQDNQIRICISSGRAPGEIPYSPTAGFVGINFDCLQDFPKFNLDIKGIFRSSGTALLAATTGFVAIGSNTTILSNNPNFFQIGPGTVVVKLNGNIGINTMNPTSRLEIAGGSITVSGGQSGIRVSTVCLDDGCFSSVSGLGGGGGGSSVSGTSTTLKGMRAFGDEVISTNPGSNGMMYSSKIATFNITAVWPFHDFASTHTFNTCISTYGIGISTGHAGGASSITLTSIDVSSWTVSWSTPTGAIHVPSVQTRILPFQSLYVLQMTDPFTCGGDAPGGVWGMEIYGWFEP